MHIMVFLVIENGSTFSVTLVRAPFALTREWGAAVLLRSEAYHN
jgi:hypothetical protein